MTNAEPTVLRARSLRRWLAPAAILGLMAVAYAFGLHRYLSLESLAENRDALAASRKTTSPSRC
jgi:hypothetical protein